MNQRIFSTIICLMFIFVVNTARAQQASTTPENLSNAEKLYGLSMFWKEASYNFAFFDQVPDLDWDAAYERYIPKVLATKSTKEYYRVLQSFCALLNDGHTWIGIPSELQDKKYYDHTPVIVASLGRKAIVVNVDVEHADLVPLGSEIIAVDGMPTEQYIREHVLPYVGESTDYKRWDRAIAGVSFFVYGLTLGKPQEETSYTIRTTVGEEREVTMIRNARARAADDALQWVRPRPDRDIIEHRWLEKGLLYVSLNTFQDRALIERFKNEVVPELPKAAGVIIDVRHNAGGSTGIGTAILDYFTDRPLTGAKWSTRQLLSVFKAGGWGNNNWFQGDINVLTPSDGQKYLVPVVVLMGHDTGSAAEDFLIYIDGQDRFTTVGEASIGSTGQPLIFSLPGGGNGAVCCKRDTYPDGREFVGYGIKPEIPVERTIAYLLGEEDPFLDKGVEVLKKKIAEGK